MPSSALLQPDSALALATLAVLEIVLGIDNLVVLSILVGHVPSAQRRAARLIGLSLAMLTRLALLFAVVWLIGLTVPLFTLAGHGFSLRDLILGVGGLVLMAQSVTEIHETLEGAGEVPRLRQGRTLLVVVTQIA